jgi:hypothetical protein
VLHLLIARSKYHVMCCNPKLFYVAYFKFLYNCFLKFIVHKINSEMVKFKMVVLTERKNINVTNTDVTNN